MHSFNLCLGYVERRSQQSLYPDHRSSLDLLMAWGLQPWISNQSLSLGFDGRGFQKQSPRGRQGLSI